MNETRNTESGSDDRMLEDILRHAEPRPQPGDVATARAFNSLHAQWREMTNKRRWQRRLSFAGVAATLLLALVASTQWFGRELPPAEFVQLAVLRASGSHVHHNAAQHATADLIDTGLLLQHGDELATADDTRVAIVWDGGSLRLDADTRVRFDNADTLTLLGGVLYFDSTPFGEASPVAAHLQINTALGRINHAGTQFQVGVSEEQLQVSVREGEVHIAGDRVDVTLVKGEGMALSKDGRFERHSVAAYDAAWQWATDIAPEVQLSGRTTAEVLQWIGRETGREVRFQTEAARQRANSQPRGIASLAPMPALRTIPFMTSLQVSLSDGYIVVDVADGNDH